MRMYRFQMQEMIKIFEVKNLEHRKYFLVFKATFSINALFWTIQFILDAGNRFRFVKHVHRAPISSFFALRSGNNFGETAKEQYITKNRARKSHINQAVDFRRVKCARRTYRPKEASLWGLR